MHFGYALTDHLSCLFAKLEPKSSTELNIYEITEGRRIDNIIKLSKNLLGFDSRHIVTAYEIT